MYNIGLYVGSFDPFHMGHLEVIDVLISRDHVDMIYIMPNNPNKKKPYRTDIKHRCEMIRLTLANNLDKEHRDNVIVVEEDCDTYIQTNLKPMVDVRYINIIGSDQYNYVKSNNKTFKLITDHQYVIPRDGHRIHNIYRDKNVTFLHNDLFQLFQHQYISSTLVKKNIHDDDNYDHLANEVKEYIIKHSIYPSFKRFLKEIDSKNEAKIINFRVIYLPSKDMYIKVFDRESFDKELASYEITKKYNIDVPKIIYKYENYALGYENVGSSVRDLIDQTDDSDRIYEIGLIVGKAVSQLHQHSNKKDINDPSIIFKFKKMIDSNYLDASDLCITGEVILNLTHADLNPRNIIISNDNKVIFIDITKMCEGCINNEFIGMASYDCYQLLSSLSFGSYGVVSEKATKFQEGYEKGYESFPDKRDVRLDNICKKFWELRSKQSCK